MAPFFDELRGAFFDPPQGEEFGDHDDPGDDGHDGEHADDHPAVDRDGFEQGAEESEAAAEEAFAPGFVGVFFEQLGGAFGPLPERGELDPAGGPREARDFELVDLAGEAFAELGRTFQAGQRGVEGGVGGAVEVEGDFSAFGDDGEVLPGSGGQRGAGRAALAV